MTKKAVDFDINEVFEEAKKNLKANMEASVISTKSKIEFIDDLAKYFKENNLRVIKDETEADKVAGNN